MISHRLRGLLNFHVVVTTFVAMALFLALAGVARGLGGLPQIVKLNPGLPLFLYAACVGLGMIVSARFVALFAPRIHRMSWVDSARVTTRQVISVALFLFGLLWATKDHAISRLFVGTYLVVAWSLLLFVNQGLPRLLSRVLFSRRHKVPTLFIGSVSRAEGLHEWLRAKEALGIRSVGFITAGDDAEESGRVIPFEAVIEDIRRVIEAESVSQVIVLDMPSRTQERRRMVEVCQEYGCRLLIHSDLSEQLQHPLTPVVDEGYAFFSLQEEPLEDPLNRVLKRTFDIAVSLPIVVLMLPPLCAWVWVMHRIQAPGPMFFVQRRAGHRRDQFWIYKFRSMYAKADRGGEEKQATKGDRRIFPFGQFLRQSSLDEFPQFLNVLKGDMSIVGPRPHMPVHDEEFARHFNAYRTRHFAKPGITGLAQTKGFRGEISDPALLKERISNDIYYIANWSIWMDVSITFKTTWQVLFPPKSAY